jgi:hypothetical protein
MAIPCVERDPRTTLVAGLYFHRPLSGSRNRPSTEYLHRVRPGDDYLEVSHMANPQVCSTRPFVHFRAHVLALVSPMPDAFHSSEPLVGPRLPRLQTKRGSRGVIVAFISKAMIRSGDNGDACWPTMFGTRR